MKRCNSKPKTSPSCTRIQEVIISIQWERETLDKHIFIKQHHILKAMNIEGRLRTLVQCNKVERGFQENNTVKWRIEFIWKKVSGYMAKAKESNWVGQWPWLRACGKLGWEGLTPVPPPCPTLNNTPDTSAVWSHSQPTQCGNMQAICNFFTGCV